MFRFRWVSDKCPWRERERERELTLVLASILEPRSRSSRTIFAFPLLDATCSGVMSFCGEERGRKGRIEGGGGGEEQEEEREEEERRRQEEKTLKKERRSKEKRRRREEGI